MSNLNMYFFLWEGGGGGGDIRKKYFLDTHPSYVELYSYVSYDIFSMKYGDDENKLMP